MSECVTLGSTRHVFVTFAPGHSGVTVSATGTLWREQVGTRGMGWNVGTRRCNGRRRPAQCEVRARPRRTLQAALTAKKRRASNPVGRTVGDVQVTKVHKSADCTAAQSAQIGRSKTVTVEKTFITKHAIIFSGTVKPGWTCKR
jgi:hypothetical protein